MNALDSVISISQLPAKKMQKGGSASLSDAPPEDISKPPVFLQDGGDPLMPRFDQFTPEEKQRLDEEMYRNYFFDFLNNYMKDKELEEDPYYKDQMDKYNRKQRGLPEVVPAGGIMSMTSPNISQEKNLKPAGILSINKTYDI